MESTGDFIKKGNKVYSFFEDRILTGREVARSWKGFKKKEGVCV